MARVSLYVSPWGNPAVPGPFPLIGFLDPEATAHHRFR
jgi:hypothetical protein